MKEIPVLSILMAAIVCFLFVIATSINPQFRHIVSIAASVWLCIWVIPIALICGLWVILFLST
jgi:hypothetical protein